MNKVFLLLGSNLGDRHLLLKSAIIEIGKSLGTILSQSAIYQTQSWGRADQPDYLNQVVYLETKQSANDVLNSILAIETALGRQRLEKWGSRLMDIDILFYNYDIINQDNLIIPHPELHNRRFTLEPLNEIAPELVHPVLKLTVNDLKNKLTDSLIVKKL